MKIIPTHTHKMALLQIVYIGMICKENCIAVLTDFEIKCQLLLGSVSRSVLLIRSNENKRK